MIEIKGLDEILARWDSSQAKFQGTKITTMIESLEAVHAKVPAYPPPPIGSKYHRTEKLGKSVGSGFSGGAQGQADVNTVKLGSGYVEGKFGSRLGYSEYVIGENQAGMHSSNWWKLLKALEMALDKIDALWVSAMDKLAEWMNG